MSNLIPPRPRTVGTAVDGKRHFPIVASQFNSTYVQGLIDHATAELRTLIPGATTSLLQVPGAFEIPLVVREIALQKRGDARAKRPSNITSGAISNAAKLPNGSTSFGNFVPLKRTCANSPSRSSKGC